MMDGLIFNSTVLLKPVVLICMCGLLCQAVAPDAPWLFLVLMVRLSGSADESAIGSSSDQQTATACTDMRRPFGMLLGVWHDGSAMLPSLPRQSVRACTCALMLIGGGSCHAFVFDQSASAFAAAMVHGLPTCDGEVCWSDSCSCCCLCCCVPADALSEGLMWLLDTGLAAPVFRLQAASPAVAVAARTDMHQAAGCHQQT